MYSVKEYSNAKGITESYVYKLIKQGKLETKLKNGIKYITGQNSNDNTVQIQSNNSIELEKENIKLRTEKEFLLKENDRLLKENENLKYQIKDKDFKINQLLEKLENLNDRVIGLIEWKNKAWWQKIFYK